MVSQHIDFYTGVGEGGRGGRGYAVNHGHYVGRPDLIWNNE